MPRNACKASKWVASGLKPISGYPEPANVAQFIYTLIAASHKNLFAAHAIGRPTMARGNRTAPSPRNEVHQRGEGRTGTINIRRDNTGRRRARYRFGHSGPGSGRAGGRAAPGGWWRCRRRRFGSPTSRSVVTSLRQRSSCEATARAPQETGSRSGASKRASTRSTALPGRAHE